MVNAVKKKQSKRQRFLEQLRLGWSISRAAKMSGVSRAQLYRWRDSDLKFANAWQEAEEIGVDVLEDAAYARAVEGVAIPIFDNSSSAIACKTLRLDHPTPHREGHPKHGSPSSLPWCPSWHTTASSASIISHLL